MMTKVKAAAAKVKSETGVTFNESGNYVNGQFWGTSMYTTLRGKKIRISDHGRTSEKYAQPDYNHVVGLDDLNDLIAFINELQATDPIVEIIESSYRKPLFESVDEIKPGLYNIVANQLGTVMYSVDVLKVTETKVECIFEGNFKVIPIKFVMNWETKHKVKKEVVIY